jgi:hypothetical protein
MDAYGVEKSTASERFVETSRKKLEQSMSRSLEHLEICALLVEGTIFKGQHLVVAIGIDALGRRSCWNWCKEPPRMPEWATDCSIICASVDWTSASPVCI